ncbi:MAG: bifunctional riboflavin kinase/FAD synthetase [Woeseiaceae bacterium]
MRLVRHLADMPFERLADGCVATIGAYDGLHLGHEKLLSRVFAEATARNLPPVLMSFEPMPREFFAAKQPPARLMRFREKYEALQQRGIEIFYCPAFNSGMRAIAADAFIRQILVHGLNIRHLVIGDDFRFARNREGSLDELQRAGRALGFDVEKVPSVVVAGVRVSSTAIREALLAGDMPAANTLLGRPYRMSGKIIRGKQLGRQLGYPTANVDLRRKQSAVAGIYAVRVSGLRAAPLDAVASVGTRPTFGDGKPLLEVHIFNFDEDIYGEYISVDFVQRLRSEEKYDSVDALVAQMHRDADNAKSVLANYTA